MFCDRGPLMAQRLAYILSVFEVIHGLCHATQDDDPNAVKLPFEFKFFGHEFGNAATLASDVPFLSSNSFITFGYMSYAYRNFNATYPGEIASHVLLHHGACLRPFPSIACIKGLCQSCWLRQSH